MPNHDDDGVILIVQHDGADRYTVRMVEGGREPCTDAGRQACRHEHIDRHRHTGMAGVLIGRRGMW